MTFYCNRCSNLVDKNEFKKENIGMGIVKDLYMQYRYTNLDVLDIRPVAFKYIIGLALGRREIRRWIVWAMG